MTVIRVNPQSVQHYGTQAQSIFDEIHAALGHLVERVASVRYTGPNAARFKTECGRLATEFAQQLHHDIAAMADAVRTSTSNIAVALGGSPISIRIDHRPISAPPVAAGDQVDVDTADLEGVTPDIRASFDTLRSALDRHLACLERTDWEGNAKRAAVSAVGGFTAAARGRCDAAEQSITTYVTHQLESVAAADR